jgi:hypothetical protein
VRASSDLDATEAVAGIDDDSSEAVALLHDEPTSVDLGRELHLELRELCPQFADFFSEHAHQVKPFAVDALGTARVRAIVRLVGPIGSTVFHLAPLCVRQSIN